MKKTGILIIFLFLTQLLSAQKKYENNIGLDFLGFHNIGVPRYNLPGNNKNPYLENASGRTFGLYYERFLKKHSSLSLESGIYFNHLFSYAGEVKDLKSVSVPVGINGDLLGKRRTTRLYFGYTGGIVLNFLAHDVASGSDWLTGADYQVSPKKYFYIAPYVGANTGVNFWNMCLSFHLLYHFLVPEYLTFKTVYENDQNNEITEYNTNKHWGITFRMGLSYRF